MMSYFLTYWKDKEWIQRLTFLRISRLIYIHCLCLGMYPHLAAEHPLPTCSEEKSQDSSGSVSQEVKDCLRQQQTEADS